MSKLLVKRLSDTAKLPMRAHATDAGLDIYIDNIKKVFMHGGGNGERILEGDHLKMNGRVEDGVLTLSYLERALVGTGLKVAIPEGYELQVRPRSGLALNDGIEVVNSPGTIDSGYRDELCVIIKNGRRADTKITHGQKIAQLVFQKVEPVEVEESDTLPSSERGNNGFGSTGNV